jgi:integrase
MPKKSWNQIVTGQFFRWVLKIRNGVYFADGRSNSPSLGRYTLETRTLSEALTTLRELDLRMAVKHGMAQSELLNQPREQVLALEDGRDIYERHVRRPAVARGPKPTTAKRYRAVLDKFFEYCEQNRINYWNEVNREVLDGYGAWLDAEAYAYATEYLELTTLKQVLKVLVQKGRLPNSALFPYSLRKPTGTDTYCWSQEEVQAILQHCVSLQMDWLHAILLTLAWTGMRIGELAVLRWSDIDLERKLITLQDESTRNAIPQRDRRTTKSGHSRSFPIHAELLELLVKQERHTDGFVFHGPLGGKVKPDVVRRALVREILEPLSDRFPAESGQPGFIDGRLHSFRHYFCSMCANQQVPERMLMNWLGHRHSSMVHRYYHLHDKESQQQMGRLNRLSSEIPSSR